MVAQVLSAKTVFTRCSLRPAFLAEVAAFLGTRRVLEIFAGDGLLTRHLIGRGIAVTATGWPAAPSRGGPARHVAIAVMDAAEAVRGLGARHDVLLVSWPPASPSLVAAVRAWKPERPVLYIGEVPPPDRGIAPAGSDAIAEVFAHMEICHTFTSYAGPTTLDQALVLMRKRDDGGGRR